MTSIRDVIGLDMLLGCLSFKTSWPTLLRIGDGNNDGSCSLKFVKESIMQVKVESFPGAGCTSESSLIIVGCSADKSTARWISRKHRNSNIAAFHLPISRALDNEREFQIHRQIFSTDARARVSARRGINRKKQKKKHFIPKIRYYFRRPVRARALRSLTRVSRSKPGCRRSNVSQ